ncbi:hypothetical protein BCR34DRAFT_61633 [Clohesyomyces aquaticus]|uniref:SH3 domain-containing protein n=1 Tax=Clohesyomyces aquaticus TaxID=1231657 RepID=A0A1Y2A3M0_9PLEO|nr:hypothetical protein BCR34DRAFT_61633 [Clohesyomyces aquaticus]
MTRPHIIRADTLDLQDKTSPTAQDHSRQPQHPAPLGIGPAAPHQEASLRHVDDERASEESHLRNGTWSDSNTLREDPGSDDERTVVNSADADRNLQQDEQAVRLNGGMTGAVDEGELQDADVEEDMDDDMMDKISSSPSIDDGGYSLPSSPADWPKRGSSLAPYCSPTPSPSSSAYVDSSSPFTSTPIHFPLSVAAAAQPLLNVPVGSAETLLSSSYRASPIPFILQAAYDAAKIKSKEHHRGEYTSRVGKVRIDTDAEDSSDSDTSPLTHRLKIVEARLQERREDSEGSLMSEFNEEDVQIMLRPLPSPVGRTNPLHIARSATPPWKTDEDNGDESEEESWTDDSDADSYGAIHEVDDDYDDDSNDIFFSDDPRFIDSGWGGECLRETEDIDFEFVYALHTFVATVEGQANATKGDTMVLLDDSNSYWWLVRVVKDSSIGYLPAEHIETPTERLARLNKHRNIDLSATMLGDTAEKTKNPLKKAMRRRNAKTVQFAPPTYVEASDYDYSSDEDKDDDELFGGADPNQAQAETAKDKSEAEQDDGLKVQPLKVGAAKTDPERSDSDTSRNSNEDPNAKNVDKARTSDEVFDRPLDPKVSRNGTMRNTDSFFKDDNAETRKITLTPNLLRDDSSTSTTGSRERGPSLESLEKNGFADKVKDDKKKKEKKPGMLSGLFKRKEKKPKGAPGALDSFDSDAEKQSEELGRSSPQSKASDDSHERPSTEQSQPQRQASKGKLQKPQRSRDDSPTKNQVLTPADSPEPATLQNAPTPKETPTSNGQPTAPATMRLVSPEQEDPAKSSSEARVQSPENRSRSNSAASKLNPTRLLHRDQEAGARPEKVKKAKQRVQLDDFDSSDEDKVDPFADPKESQAKAPQAEVSEPTGRLSESPVHISAADAQPNGKENAHHRDREPDPHQPPGLTGDTSSQETTSPISTPSPDDSPSTKAPPASNLPVSRPTGSPSPTSPHSASSIPPPSRPAPVPTKEMELASPPTSSESSTLPAWSDASLRSYLDDGSDIRDMLMVINDTTGVVPVSLDHPLMARLYTEETRTVTQLGGELDGLLATWLESKRKKRRDASKQPLR